MPRRDVYTDNVFRPNEEPTLPSSVTDNVFRPNQETPQPVMYSGIVNTGTNTEIVDQATENMIAALDPVLVGDDPTLNELLNSSAVYGSLNKDVDTIRDTYNAVRNINDDKLLTDEEKQGVYRDAVSKMLEIPEEDLGKYFQKPDEALPFMVAGASLKASGKRGDSLGESLLEAFMSYRVAKKSGERAFDKQIKDYELSKKKLVDRFLVDLAIDDERTLNNIAQAYLNDRYFETPKMYMISDSKGEFVNPPKVMSDFEVSRFKTNNPNVTIRPYDKAEDDLKNYTIRYREKDGTTSEVSGLMTKGAVRNYIPIDSGGLGKYDNVLSVEEGAGNTNLKNYLIEYTDGREATQISLNPDQYTAYNNEKDSRGIKSISQLTGGFTWAIDNRGDSPVLGYFSNAELASAGPGDFAPKPGMSLEVSKDGSVVLSDGTPNSMLTAKYKDGRKKGEEIRTKIDTTETLVDNYFISARAVDELLAEFEGNRDLLMNNLAAQGATFADKVVVSINAIGDLFRSPAKEGGYTFKVGDETVSYDDFQSSIIDSPEWQEFSKGPLGQTLKDAGITGQAFNAALFDLAMIAASTYGNKESLDMRALSDKDVAFFLKTQGNEAYSFDGYLKIIGGFRRRLLERNINVLEKYLDDPAYFYEGIIDERGNYDLDWQKTTNDRIRTILGVDEEGNETGEGLYGLLSETADISAPNATPTLKRTDDVSSTDKNEIDLTELVLDPQSQNVIQAFGAYGVTPSKTYTQNTELRNGYSIGNLVNMYLATPPESQARAIFLANLKKQLREEEYAAFDIYKSLAVRNQ